MRILFLNYEYPPLGGGAANATAYILEEFSKIDDLEVELVTSSTDDQYHCDCINNRVRIHRLPIGKNAQTLHFQSVKDLIVYTWKSWRFSRLLLKQKSFDITQAFFTVPCGLVAWQLKREFGTPYVVSLRGSDVPGYSDRFAFLYIFLRPVVRVIWHRAKSIIANSKGLKDLTLQTDRRHTIEVIPNGVDVEHFVPRTDAPTSSDAVIHLTLGASRLTDRKGIKYLIEAIHLLRNECQFSLEIIGDGNAKKRLERLVTEYALESSITFVGRIPREDTLAYYQRADIFVLPSLNEGMSNAMLEALACGLPMVTTRTGGAEELVIDGDNGFLVEQRDAQDLARALRILATDAVLRARMGEKSRLLAVSMSWECIASQYVDAYKKIMN